MNGTNVLVLGSGVSGLTTALKLLKANHRVTIWSKEPDPRSPHTSLNAYAMWVPVKIDSDPRVERWADESLVEFTKLSCESSSGVAIRQICVLKVAREEPWYAGKIACFRHPRPGEIPPQYQDAHILERAPVIDPGRYLPWLRGQVAAAGAIFANHEVKEFAALPGEYSAIVNCTGLGARQLAGDRALHPERVQVVTIKHNGFDRVVIDDEGPNKRACIVPHTDYIKLGAVFSGDNESLKPDDTATDDILARCAALMPGFSVDRGDILSVTCALRPERSLTRVEEERLADDRLVIHNYGHDGMGYILSWGIAGEIAARLTP